jgi:hypothetical protein
MPRAFDPYFLWLGIPAREQPPDHYRLLGLPALEGDYEAIELAATERLRQVSALKQGNHAAEAQRIELELAAARDCLLSPPRKAAYDGQLMQHLLANMPPPETEETVALESPAPSYSSANAPAASAAPRRPTKSKDMRIEVAKHIVASLAGLAIGYVILGFLRADWDGLGIARWVRSFFGSPQ